MSDRLKKILVVIFLTFLIWAWAFMSLEEPLTRSGSLKVSSASDPSLLVTFLSTEAENNPQTEILLASLDFTGPPSEVSKLKKRYNLLPKDPDKERLDFYYDPSTHGGTAGVYKLKTLEHLQNDSKMKELALTLESCKPEEVTVTIEKLVKKELPVECKGIDNKPLKGAVSDPPIVEVYVREKNPPESATVVLSPQMIDNARKQPVKATPYVELGVAKERREAAKSVQITLTSEQQLEPKLFKTGKAIGITISQELQKKYKVTIINDAKARETAKIFATNEAFKAYENMTYPLQIEISDITDSDIGDLPQPLSRTVIYNFPPKYVRSGEIELADQLPRLVDIKIELINPEPN